MTELKINLDTLKDDLQQEYKKLTEQGDITNLNEARAFKLGIDTALSLFGVSKRETKCEYTPHWVNDNDGEVHEVCVCGKDRSEHFC